MANFKEYYDDFKRELGLDPEAEMEKYILYRNGKLLERLMEVGARIPDNHPWFVRYRDSLDRINNTLSEMSNTLDFVYSEIRD